MKKEQTGGKKQKNRKVLWISLAAVGVLAIAGGFLIRELRLEKPDELLVTYMNHIPKQEYEQMYAMIDAEASGNISKEDFINRNSAIYEGIEIQNMTVQVTNYNKTQGIVSYQTSFDTAAGEISFENDALFVRGKNGYELVWEDSLIFPELTSEDKVRVTVKEAERGEIQDRDGRVLAGKGVASSVGIVPGKLENRDSAVKQIAQLLEMQPEDVETKLSASWVTDDSFVPLKTVTKVEEVALMSMTVGESLIQEKERQDKLLEIPGVMITDTPVRKYPLGEAAAHLVGYVQNVTAEDLEEHKGEGYTSNSVIGRSGMESLFEKELKGSNGCRIYIVDAEGNEKKELAYVPVKNGKDIKLTIDADLQTELYQQYKDDKSCSVVMNPCTGEVLALVSTPAYDNNDFIIGLSDEQWTALNEDENKPMYNRFRQVWCPGSTFKPIIAAIGLETGAIDPAKDYGTEGTSWQKDDSWGGYYVTTLHEYEPVTLENALIYSDNIYFAKAALNIGAENLMNALKELGFGEKLPFEIQMSEAQYSNTDTIETEIQLADSGYGQGQILINPLHLACLYSAFCNEGNVIKPYLVYQKEAEPEYWIEEAFSANTANTVLEGLKKVISDPNGTGSEAHREDVVLAGKTGTAEVKASQEDTSGTELGWFAVMTPEKETKSPILMVNMVEDVKDRGGSGYVVGKDKQILDNWFENH